MKTILTLILFLVIGFIGSRGLFTRVKSRLPVVALLLTGIEFFFLGVLLGPRFLDLITPHVGAELEPVVYLALGWAGLLFGIQLSWQNIQRLSRNLLKFLTLDALVVGGFCAVCFYLYLRGLFPYFANADSLSGAAVLSITAAISSPTIVFALSRVLPSRGKFTSMAKVATSLSAVIPLFAFGLLSTVGHPGFFVTEGFLSGLLWWVFANAVGVVMGVVFVLLTLQKSPKDERLLVIIGTVMFMGGICYLLRLSALYTAMVMGIVVGNLSRRRVQIFEQLITIEKTIYIAFLILVGAKVTLPGWEVLWLLIFYIVLRLFFKLFVSRWLIGRGFPEFRAIGLPAGLAFSAQGGMALAVALDYGHGASGPLVDMIVTVIAFSVVVNEFVGVFLTRRSFEASGEVTVKRAMRADRKPAAG